MSEEFAKNLQTVKDAFAILATDGDIAEITAEVRGMPPHVIGQLIMECVNPDEPLSMAQKKFWLEVSEYLGPDFLDALSKAVAFMRRVQNFE